MKNDRSDDRSSQRAVQDQRINQKAAQADIVSGGEGRIGGVGVHILLLRAGPVGNRLGDDTNITDA